MNDIDSAPDAPLTDKQVRSRSITVERHEPPAPEPAVATLRIQASADSEPEVELHRTEDGWELSVRADQATMIDRAPVRPVRLSRRALDAAAQRSEHLDLPPSIPADRDDLIAAPRVAQARRIAIQLGLDRDEQPTTVFAPDGRGTYYDERYPWRCLVRMTRPSGWSGSGALIGPRHVLTASHCVDWTPGWLRVDVLYTNGSQLAQAHGTLAYHVARVTRANYSQTNRDDDYAVIVLDQRLGDRFGWLGCRTWNTGWDDRVLAWRNLGYPQDFSNTGELATYQRDFALIQKDYDADAGKSLESDTFDNWPGQSGGPVFGFFENGPYAVGTVSGQSSSANFVAGGSRLTELVRRARDENP